MDSKVATKYPPAAPDQSPILRPLGGWLLLLVMGLMFLGPLVRAGWISADFLSAESQYPILTTGADWGTFKSATWWTFLLVCCLSFYAGLGLMKSRNILVVKRAKIILWVIGPVYGIVLAIFIPLLVFGRIEYNPAEFVGSMIGSIIPAAIWTAYLSKSKRVMATYDINVPST